MPFKRYDDGAVDRSHQLNKQSKIKIQKIECNLADVFDAISRLTFYGLMCNVQLLIWFFFLYTERARYTVHGERF